MDPNLIRQQQPLVPIRVNPIGSFFNFPNWRYMVYLEPGRANLAYCRRRVGPGAQCLLRYMEEHPKEIGAQVSVQFGFSSFFNKAIRRMTMAQRDVFYKLFNKKLRLQGDRKAFAPSYSNDKVELWNGKYIPMVVDKPLQAFLLHVTHIKFCKNYDFAMKLKNSPAHERILCTIGYSIYAGLSDVAIARRYKMFPGQVKALRELFFDFTHAPTDVVARAAYFTQLSDNEMISDVDRRYYKIVSSLGELGLKADADPYSLSAEEKAQLNTYLADSMLENVSSLYFSIQSKQDALAYNGVINNLAAFFIKKEEVNYIRSKVRNLDASTTRIANERTNYDSDMGADDVLALETISRLALRENAPPTYRSITELNSSN